MHPAYSVIFFTTASGAGYGLWVLLGLRILFAGVPDAPAASIVPRLSWCGIWSASASCRPPSTSATRNGRGGRWASGGAHGSRAKAWRRWRPTCPRASCSLRSSCPAACRGPALRGAAGPGRRGDGLVHRHDLCIAAHGAGMEPRSGAGDLPRARLGNGRGCCWPRSTPFLGYSVDTGRWRSPRASAVPC
jgi:hypothetical protein